MRIKPTSLTVNCCELIRALLPSDQETLMSIVHVLSNDLQVQPLEIIDLLNRTPNPGAEPVFDGTHTHEDWYNNNLQMPRLLIGICNHLGIEDVIPTTYRISPRLNDTLCQSRIFMNAYIGQQRALLP